MSSRHAILAVLMLGSLTAMPACGDDSGRRITESNPTRGEVSRNAARPTENQRLPRGAA